MNSRLSSDKSLMEKCQYSTYLFARDSFLRPQSTFFLRCHNSYEQYAGLLVQANWKGEDSSSLSQICDAQHLTYLCHKTSNSAVSGLQTDKRSAQKLQQWGVRVPGKTFKYNSFGNNPSYNHLWSVSSDLSFVLN